MGILLEAIGIVLETYFGFGFHMDLLLEIALAYALDNGFVPIFRLGVHLLQLWSLYEVRTLIFFVIHQILVHDFSTCICGTGSLS